MHNDDDSDTQGKKIRKQFARGISVQAGDRNNSQLKHMSEIAPSAHHRFDKESVHLRLMYRKLYPNEASSVNKLKQI